MVLPLGGDSDPSSDSEGDQDDPEDDFVPETLLDRIHGMRRPIWRYLVVDLGSFRIHSYSAVGCNRRLQKWESFHIFCNIATLPTAYSQ